MIHILWFYYNENLEFREFLAGNLDISAKEILVTLLKDKFPVGCLYDKYNQVYRYFDDLVVVGRADGKFTFKVKKSILKLLNGNCTDSRPQQNKKYLQFFACVFSCNMV